VRGRPLSGTDSRRHSLEVDIEAVRADSVFTPFRDHLRSGRMDAAREALRAVVSRGRQPVEREVAEYDLIEVDFFEARFDTAAVAYREFAVRHPRGYLTNDAIGRVFLIDENSDSGQKPLVLYAQAAREARAGRPDSAATLLKQTVERYPGTALADDLILALGDVTLRTATPAAALAHYQAVADSIPDSPLAPAAMMRIGRYRAEVDQDFAAAIGAYEQVLERFPESLEADEARKLIERLRRRT
jgi:outer membrane protein assembly factor BamD (BamD/ComL family)